MDSSLDVSLYIEETWRRVRDIVTRPHMKSTNNIMLVDFSGTRIMGELGEVGLHLLIDSIYVYHRVLVVKSLMQLLLLGKDFMSIFKCFLDFDNGKVPMCVSCLPVTLPMCSNTTLRKIETVRFDKNVDQYSSKEISQVTKDMPPKHDILVLKPTSSGIVTQ